MRLHAVTISSEHALLLTSSLIIRMLSLRSNAQAMPPKQSVPAGPAPAPSASLHSLGCRLIAKRSTALAPAASARLPAPCPRSSARSLVAASAAEYRTGSSFLAEYRQPPQRPHWRTMLLPGLPALLLRQSRYCYGKRQQRRSTAYAERGSHPLKPPRIAASSIAAGGGQRPRRLRGILQVNARCCPPHGKHLGLRKGRPVFRSVLLRSSFGQQLRKLRCCLSASLRATALHSVRSLLRRQAWRSTALAPAAFCLLCRLPLRHSSSTHCSSARALLARSPACSG